MTMNLRSDMTFVQDEGWYAASNRYDDFIRRHENLHILFLELGVGANTPVIIKYPFWQMTAKNPNAAYALSLIHIFRTIRQWLEDQRRYEKRLSSGWRVRNSDPAAIGR